eukprot:gene2015-2337_t
MYVELLAGNTDEAVDFPLEVPILPFPVEEVLLPGSVKTLHLYEARYLSLLDEVLSNPSSNKLFVHTVVEQLGSGDPVGSKAAGFPGAYVGERLVLLMATMVRVQLLPGPGVQVLEVKTVQVGALVKIQAEARVSITSVTQGTDNPQWSVQMEVLGAEAGWAQPFMRGIVGMLPDEPLCDRQRVSEQVEQLKTTMQEQLQLLRCCVKAMETRDTSRRLQLVHEHMQDSFKLLAAKCALKSLRLG